MKDFFIFPLKYGGTYISEDASRVIASAFFSLNVFSDLIGFYTLSSIILLSYSNIKVIYCFNRQYIS